MTTTKKTPKTKGWISIAHTRIGDAWCFAWAAWTGAKPPTARAWVQALATGEVAQLDGRGAIVVDAHERAIAAASKSLPAGAIVQIEDGFALAAHREAAGEEPRYRPVAAPGIVAEAYFAVIEVDRTKALPKQAVTIVQVDVKGTTLAVIDTATRTPRTDPSKPTGQSAFWAVWTSCGRPTFEPWTPPDDLGIIEGHGAHGLAIGAADEACRRLRGGQVFAYSVGDRFAARAYTSGARCTSSKLVDISTTGLVALAWIGLDKTATEGDVRRAWGKKVRDEKLHPDAHEGADEKALAETAFKIAEAHKRAAIDYLAVLARSTGKVGAFAQEKIDRAAARKAKAAEKKARKEAGLDATA